MQSGDPESCSQTGEKAQAKEMVVVLHCQACSQRAESMDWCLEDDGVYPGGGRKIVSHLKLDFLG